jgi:hypothetical protein
MAKGAIFHGMPPMHSRSVASNGTKSARYHGSQYPGSKNALANESTMGKIFDRDGTLIDSPITDHGEQADRRGTSKADEVAAIDPSAGLGTDLSQGPLGRATRAGR